MHQCPAIILEREGELKLFLTVQAACLSRLAGREAQRTVMRAMARAPMARRGNDAAARQPRRPSIGRWDRD
jgi:hypothetical protein